MKILSNTNLGQFIRMLKVNKEFYLDINRMVSALNECKMINKN